MDLSSVTAAGIMNGQVLTLREDADLKEAISGLAEYQISGAPVLNVAGECVGVFSTTDVVRRGEEQEAGEGPQSGDYFSIDPFIEEDPDTLYFSREDYDERVLGRDTVGQWMSTQVISVPPSASLQEICGRMAGKRIHRVLVMEGTKLLGIVTSLDIVRLLAGPEGAEPRRARRQSEARKSAKAGGPRRKR